MALIQVKKFVVLSRPYLLMIRNMVLVVVDEPSKPYAYGSTVAVPVAKEIIESLIVIEKIPPRIADHGVIVKKP